MKKIRVGIIGTGFGASVHAPIFSLHEGFEVQAITSIHRGHAHVATHNLGIPNVYTDWKSMLAREQLDLVCITSRPPLHYEMALACLRQGLYILCEKPLGMNADETRMLLKELEASNRPAFVNFEWRLTPIRLKIKEMLNNKQLGTIQSIKYQGSFSGYKNLTSGYRGWDGRSSDGGGHIFAVGSHMLDSLMWWMNEPIVDVIADLRTMVPYYNGQDGIEERDAEDAFTIIGHFRSGAAFTIDFLTSAVRGEGWKLEFYGTEGTLVMENDRDLRVSYGGDYQPIAIDTPEPPSQLSSPANLYYSAFYPMVDNIYQAIIHKKVSSDIPTFEDGHRVQLVMDAIFHSSKNREQVLVKI
ncbi:Gfo/Idh/MocA family oxidoreductase [Paenibacillus albiflavus]|uniref:Gfo/Idh/MocA family oxidoreductase n=1 Tax=Paenibacillus albiflavus TaxID=2545760 RepID=A0A4R4EJ59_9BACL|nr:Gfo/Idh/MocA family oxidoreductase [Paenibacillus albiflavus]TCZ79280.1 Gfo/Idh/MocA family oxidoreductase [Paenibacillus albiflavus]